MRGAILGLLLIPLGAQEVDPLVRSGLVLLEKGDAKGALEAFDGALARNPKSADARVGRARARLVLRHPAAEILDDFARAIVDDPRHVDAYFNRALLLLDLNRSEEALKDFDRVLELAPGAAVARAVRGDCLRKLNRFEEAVRDLSQAVDEGIRTPQTYYARAYARTMTLDPRGVVADATRVLDVDPGHPGSLGMRWRAYFQLEAWDNALRDIHAFAKASKGISERTAIWMFMTRCQSESRKAAQEILQAQWDASQVAQPGEWKIAPLFLGLRGEKETLAGASEPAIELFAGFARRVAGDPDGALPLFERALKGLDPYGSDAADARAAIRRIKRDRNRARIEALEDKVRALKPFEARFEADNVDFGSGNALKSVDLLVDYARRGVFFRVAARVGEKDTLTLILCDELKMSIWGDAEVRGTLDATSFIAGFEEIVDGMTRSLDRIVPKVAKPGDPPARKDGLILNLTLEGRATKEAAANLRFASGWGTHPASWLKEALDADDAQIRDEGDEVVLDLPAARKRFRVDRETGFPRLFEARDGEGDGVHRLRRTSFKLLDAWPGVDVPADLKPLPLDPGELRKQLETQDQALVMYLLEAMNRWEAIEAAEEVAQVEASVTRWAARYADSAWAFAVRRLAGAWIKEALGNGADVGGLLKAAEAHAGRFADRLAADDNGLGAFVRESLGKLAYRVETGVIGSWVDSRTHAPLRKLLRAALDPERVGTARRAAYGDRLEKLFREELETYRQL